MNKPAPGGIMTVAEVAALLGIAPATVTDYLKESRTPAGRYVRDPFPAPTRYVGAGEGGTNRGRRPVWAADRAKELVDWKRRQVGRGAGSARRGRVYADAVERALAKLGDAAPERYRQVGWLRVHNPDTRLADLAARCDPPLTERQAATALQRLLRLAEN